MISGRKYFYPAALLGYGQDLRRATYSTCRDARARDCNPFVTSSEPAPHFITIVIIIRIKYLRISFYCLDVTNQVRYSFLFSWRKPKRKGRGVRMPHALNSRLHFPCPFSAVRRASPSN